MDSSSPLANSCSQYDIRRFLHCTRKKIENVRDQIKTTAGEIKKANLLLRELNNTEIELQEAAEAAARLLSPFQRVPMDIIGNIAEHATSFGDIVSGIDRGIWPLTHVCSSWRNAILSLPHLWSSFTIGRYCYPPLTLRLLFTVLERSGSHSLSFFMTPGAPVELQAAVMPLLVEHSERWKKAYINTAIGPTILLPLHKRLPRLECLFLKLADTSPEQGWCDSEAERRIFEDAPNLTKIEFPTPWNALTSFPIRFKLPIHHLRVIHSSWSDSVPKLGIWDVEELPGFQMLQSLDLREPNWAARRGSTLTWNNGSQRRIRLHALKHISLEYPSEFLDAFETPLLTSLTLHQFPLHRDSLPVLQTFMDLIRPGQLKTVDLTLTLVSSDPEEDIPFKVIVDMLSHPAFEQVYSLSLGSYESSGSLRWFKVFLLHATYSHPQSHVTGRKPAIHLPFLRRLALQFVTSAYTGSQGVFRAIEEFIISRTSLIDRLTLQGGSGNEDQSLPTRLEDVHIQCGKFFQPITLNNYQHLGGGMIQLSDS